jgi:hypothetical protein
LNRGHYSIGWVGSQSTTSLRPRHSKVLPTPDPLSNQGLHGTISFNRGSFENLFILPSGIK